jgi:protein arginine kinase
LEIAAMVERHVISADFAAKGENGAILLNEDETVCVMIGEEDHIRIQVVLGGLNLENAYNIAYKTERLLDGVLHFAFDERLGYLTACPTNLGTGLRAGVMLHLPVLEAENSVANLSESIRKIGFTVRGIYGEGSRSKASMYQISNQITLGIDEKTAIDNLSVITKQITQQEMQRREAFSKTKLEDIAWRAYGNLKFARILSSEEMFREVSKIKLGIGMGIIECEKTLPMKILIETQPNMLMCRFGNMTPDERDAKRAEMVRAMLK